MGKIGIIINPNAKRNSRRDNLRQQLECTIGDHGMVRVTRTPHEVYSVAEEFLREKIEILGVSGGDGTMQKTLSRFIEVCGEECLPSIATIRGGTMNTIANSLKIRGTPVTITQRIMGKIHASEELNCKEVDLMRVGNEYGSLFGTGVVYNFLDAYYEGGKTGTRKAIRVIIRAIASALTGGSFAKKVTAPVPARASLDGRPIPFEEFSGILACTICDIGLGFKPLYRAEERDGYFHILSTNMNTLQIILRIHKLFLGIPMKNSQVHDEIGQELTLEALKGNIPFMLDGELFSRPGRIQLKAGPRIRVIAP